jgi:hypothetical protein
MPTPTVAFTTAINPDHHEMDENEDHDGTIFEVEDRGSTVEIFTESTTIKPANLMDYLGADPTFHFVKLNGRRFENNDPIVLDEDMYAPLDIEIVSAFELILSALDDDTP